MRVVHERDGDVAGVVTNRIFFTDLNKICNTVPNKLQKMSVDKVLFVCQDDMETMSLASAIAQGKVEGKKWILPLCKSGH